MKGTILQLGYRIDEPRPEAVTINARQYADLAAAAGWRVEAVAYDGTALSFARLASYLRRVAGRCQRDARVVVHDFFVMPGLSLVVMLYLRWRRMDVPYIKTFINPPGGGRLGSVEGLLRLVMNNRIVCRLVTWLADRVTFLRPMDRPNARVLAVPLRYPPAEPADHDKPVRVAYLGHALAKKGVRLLPEIVRHVQTMRPGAAEFAFSLSGLCDCQAAVDRLSHMPHCRVTGPVDPHEFFRGADVYLLPIRDGFAASGSFNTIWEAMSAGCCLVTTRTDGLPEIVSRENAERVGNYRPWDFAEAIIRLIDEPQRLRAMRARAAGDYARAHAGSSAEVAAQLRALYEPFSG